MGWGAVVLVLVHFSALSGRFWGLHDRVVGAFDKLEIFLRNKNRFVDELAVATRWVSRAMPGGPLLA